MPLDQPEVPQADDLDRMNRRELWRRYRGVAVSSLALGAVLGWIVALIIGGDTRMIGHKFLLGGSFGVATAFMACLGGFISLFFSANGRALNRSQRENAGAAGAGIAVIVGWLLFAAWASIDGGSAGWFMFFLPVAVISGVVTWVVASFGLHFVEGIEDRRRGKALRTRKP